MTAFPKNGIIRHKVKGGYNMKKGIVWLIVVAWACVAFFCFGQYYAATNAKVWRDGNQIHIEVLGEDYVHIAD